MDNSKFTFEKLQKMIKVVEKATGVDNSVYMKHITNMHNGKLPDITEIDKEIMIENIKKLDEYKKSNDFKR